MAHKDAFKRMIVLPLSVFGVPACMNIFGQYRRLIDASSDCIKELDANGMIRLLNSQTRRILGAGEYPAAIGRLWVETWPERARDRVLEAVAQARDGRRSHFTAERSTSLGEPRWWSVSVHPIFDRDEGLDVIVVVSRDVTAWISPEARPASINQALREHLRASMAYGIDNTSSNEQLTAKLAHAQLTVHDEGQRLAKLSERLESSGLAARDLAEEVSRQALKNQAIGQLVAGLAHDFNNMLQTTILSLSAVLDKPDQLSADQQRMLGYAMEGSRHASLLAKRLLGFARAHKFKPEPVELLQLVGGIADFAVHSMGAGMDLRVGSSNAPSWIMADRHSVEQAFLNLCLNARDACHGRGVINVCFGRLNVPHDVLGESSRMRGDYATLAVSDGGCGMSEEVLQRLFEPYFTTKQEEHGTGLGLAQVYGLMRQSGGFVDVESALEKGATVTLAFPVMQMGG